MYEAFKPFLIRTPYFHFDILKEISFENMIYNPAFKEAIYLASPVLYNESMKYCLKSKSDTHKINKIESALYRYATRMSSRCTPFGLFAGLSIGHIDNKTNIILGDYERHTKLDMQFLYTLSQELSKLPEIKYKVKYYPNTSIYKVGNIYRYIECKYTDYEQRHQIVSVEYSVHLAKIFKITEKGKSIKEIIDSLTNENFEYDDALEYIEELIESQLLINELYPSVTGEEYFQKIINILKDLNFTGPTVTALSKIKKTIKQLDFNISDCTTNTQQILLYNSIIQEIKEIKIPFEENRLFHVIMKRKLQESTLGKNIIQSLKSALVFLSKTSYHNKNKTLEDFKEAFYNRYEERVVPLMEVLDPDIGISYPLGNKTDNILLDDLCFPNLNKESNYFQQNKLTSILLKKCMAVSKSGDIEILLDDNDIAGMHPDLNGLPSTLYSMFNILTTEADDPIIHLYGFYGISAAKILTRFADSDSKIHQFINEIVSKEDELYPDKILVEIVHLPQPKIGNVIAHPHIRKYEIPYLTRSDLPQTKIINVSDMLISIKAGEIRLYSKTLKKEILPRLTNAHNYSDSPIPVYKFLSQLQQQGGTNNLLFNWGYLSHELDFLPRVTYKNVILSLATWKLDVAEIRGLGDLNNGPLLEDIRKWRKSKSLPTKMILSDYDNELLIDWENIQSIKSLASIIKNKSTITLKEFIYDKGRLVVKDRNMKSYTNECIVCFYKETNK